MRPRWVRLRTLILVLFLLISTAGCHLAVDVTLSINDEHGQGTARVDATLDAETVAAIDGVDEARFDDLIAADWAVADPVVADDGSVTLSATKDFASPAEMTQVLAEISGPEGPFARFALRTDRAFARTSYRLEGVLDGTMGVDGFADAGLAEALDGLAFGVDLDDLEAELGAPLGSLVTLRMRVALPGDDTGGGLATATYTTEGDEQLVVWETTLDAAEPVPVLLTSEITRFRSVAFVLGALALAVLFVIILLAWVVTSIRRRRRRRRAERLAATTPRPIPGHQVTTDVEPEHVGEAPTAPVPEPVAPDGSSVSPGEASRDEISGDEFSGDDVHQDASAAAGVPVGEGSPPPLKLVVIGGPGVAFGVRDQADDVVAFARAHGSLLEYPRIADHYLSASLGRMSTSEMWMAIGAEGDPGSLDEEFLGQYQLAPGLRDFVGRARDRGYRVAYLGDGPAAWADQLRRSFVLDDLVDPWVVSGTVGAVLPDVAMFEALRRLTAVDPASCLLIDDRLRVLEEARALGFGTAWFSPAGRATEAPGHSIIRGFVELLSG